MDLLGSFFIACSMYSKIPVPQVQWTNERMKYALCFFPLIGIVIGTAIWGLGKIAILCSISELAYACFGTVIPIVITGGIHLDGFIDVVDARSSYQSREKKLEILKDPHIGAFAIIKTGLYLLVYAGLFSMLSNHQLPVFAATFVVIRALSGLSVVMVTKAKTSGIVAEFAISAENKTVAAVMVVYLLAAVFFIWKISGIGNVVAVLLTALTIFGAYIRLAKKEFGGITGDLAGYFLQVCELALLAILVIN